MTGSTRFAVALVVPDEARGPVVAAPARSRLAGRADRCR